MLLLFICLLAFILIGVGFMTDDSRLKRYCLWGTLGLIVLAFVVAWGFGLE
ncbi:MAG: hypothetical protein JWP08_3014 [Bryobacterales bacterium]|nr:hypothetical protein [Bryobacterales bacterium]